MLKRNFELDKNSGTRHHKELPFNSVQEIPRVAKSEGFVTPLYDANVLKTTIFVFRQFDMWQTVAIDENAN